MKITIKELKSVIRNVVREAKANLKVAPEWAPQVGDTVEVKIDDVTIRFNILKVSDVKIKGESFGPGKHSHDEVDYKVRPLESNFKKKVVDLVVRSNKTDHRSNRFEFEGDQSYFIFNVNDVKIVSKGSPPVPQADVTKFNKTHLICYVLFVNGTLREDQTLEKVAALEGKPYIPGSNHDYFYTSPYYLFTGKRDVVSDGYVEKIGKGKNASYVVTPKGIAVAKRVIDAIGADVGRV